MTRWAPILAVLLAVQVAAQDHDRDRAKLDLTEIRRLPVLSNTRFKPLESYARETVLAVTGEVEPKRAADGTPIRRGVSADRKRGDPVLTYLEWWLAPEEARSIPWILIDRPGARALLGYPSDQKDYDHVSYDELESNERFRKIMDDLSTRPRDRLNVDEAEIIEVNNRLAIFGQAAQLRKPERVPPEFRFGPTIVPPKGAMERGVLYEWQPVPVMGTQFPGFEYTQDEIKAVKSAFDNLATAFRDGNAAAFGPSVGGLKSAIEALHSPHYPAATEMEREVRYHRGHFFDYAAWLYLATFILAIFAAIWRNKILYVAAALPGLVGLCLNVYGLAERTALSERALLGNLYETLLYLAGISFLLSLISEWFFRSRWFLIVGSLLSMAFLRIAQDQALLLNPSISVLQPVLDRNFWIHIHVPVIVASYAPLMLAALMGNAYLLMTIFRPATSPALKEIGRIQYWAMVPGVILLFAGLILGGIWADQSWGRFWGWDPKETWGFITWVVFVALIHGRWTGWLRDYGTAVGTIIGGGSLVMTYWGVNFLLPGLHSYASANDADAGLPWWRRVPGWILSYVAVEVALVVFAAFFKKKASAEGSVDLHEPAAALPPHAPTPAAKH